jgi:hypothetical protein
MDDDDNLDVKLALEEMRFTMQQILSAGDALDQKVNALLVAAGIILTVSITLQISLSPNRSVLFWLILIILIVFYATAVVFILLSSKPNTYRLAIRANWNELNKQLFEKKEREAILTLLSGYIDQIEYNAKINRSKAELQVCSIIILAITIILIVILVCLP